MVSQRMPAPGTNDALRQLERSGIPLLRTWQRGAVHFQLSSYHIITYLSMDHHDPPRARALTRGKMNFYEPAGVKPWIRVFLRGSSPLLQADHPRCEPIAGFPGSPAAVSRGTQRSSRLLCHVVSLLPSSLPVCRVSRVPSGWRLRCWSGLFRAGTNFYTC
jgi:hypothetical protein